MSTQEQISEEEERQKYFDERLRPNLTSEHVVQDLGRFVRSCKSVVNLGLKPMGSFQEACIGRLLPKLKLCRICKTEDASVGLGMICFMSCVPPDQPPLPGKYQMVSICDACVKKRQLEGVESITRERDDVLIGVEATELTLTSEHIGYMAYEYHKFILALPEKITGYRPLECDGVMYNPDYFTLVCIDRDDPEWRGKIPFNYMDDDGLDYVSGDPEVLTFHKALAAGEVQMMLPRGALRDKSKVVGFLDTTRSVAA